MRQNVPAPRARRPASRKARKSAHIGRACVSKCRGGSAEGNSWRLFTHIGGPGVRMYVEKSPRFRRVSHGRAFRHALAAHVCRNAASVRGASGSLKKRRIWVANMCRIVAGVRAARPSLRRPSENDAHGTGMRVVPGRPSVPAAALAAGTKSAHIGRPCASKRGRLLPAFPRARREAQKKTRIGLLCASG